jgi:nicotinamide phosphoribosyltransferase
MITVNNEFIAVPISFSGGEVQADTKSLNTILNDIRNGKTDKYNQMSNVSIDSIVNYQLTVEDKGTVEMLWDIFGGEINSKGYKVLDSHIGMIYGDGITYQREKEIFERLEAKGFATTNVVFGVGSYTMNQVTRDTLGTAIKATAVKMEDGTLIPIYKDPKTDHKKKSARGLLKIVKENNEFVLIDNVTEDEEQTGELYTVFKDGQLFNEMTFDEVKQNIWN